MLKILLFLGLGLAAGVPLDFTSADEFILHVDTQPYVVALMYTQHCPHCVVLERQFIQADKEWSSARGMPSTIVMANLDQATDLIDPYQLEFVPTVLVFTNGTYQHVPDDLFSSIVTLANAYYDTEVVDVDAQSFNDNIDIWMEDFDRIIAIPPTLNSLVLSEARNSHAGLYKFIRVHGNGIDMKNIGASLDITEGSSLLIDSRVREEPPILRVEDPDRSFLQWTLLNSLPEADFLTDAIFNQCLFANVPLVVLFLDDPQLLTHTFDASAFVEDMTNLAWDLRVRGIDIHFSVFGNSFELGSYEEEEDIARVAGAFGVQPSQLPAVAVYDFDQGISYPIVDLSDNAIEYVEEKLFAFLNGDVESLNPFKYATEVSEAHHPESNLVLHINGKDFYELVVEGETSSLIFYYDSCKYYVSTILTVS